MNDLLETTGLACDLTTGLCGSDEPDTRRVTITYVTDPICSACWAMEPAWRTVQHRYGDLLDVRHVYGGLLPGWDGFADPANGIHGHEHVAEHWREMAEHTGQATAVSVWDTDPIPSSFPPSMVLVAARDVAPELAETALRKLREELFVHGRNIARPDVWRDALAAAGVDVAEVEARLGDGRARDLFIADLQLARSLRATAFPTLVVEADGDRITLRGTQGLARLERVITEAAGVRPVAPSATIEEAVTSLGVGTTAEYAAFTGGGGAETERALRDAGLTARSLPGGTVWLP